MTTGHRMRFRPIGFDQVPPEERSTCWCGASLDEATLVVKYGGSHDPGDGQQHASYSFDGHIKCPSCKQVWEMRP